MFSDEPCSAVAVWGVGKGYDENVFLCLVHEEILSDASFMLKPWYNL